MPNNEVSAPTFTQQVDQTVFIEPLGGPNNPLSILDRFPDALYSKSPETHFIKFMYSLLGPAGVGWIKKQYLDAKLAIYAHGFNTFSIEKYYGDPFKFGRILTEQLAEDPEGLLTREEWDSIKAKDESYRSRSITFFNAARAGGTPEGMELAAQSGLNHAAFIVENYKYLFDQHSDEPLGLSYYGRTQSTEEFIIVPRQETSQSEQQIISFDEVFGTEGTFQLEFNGQRTGLLLYNANNFEVETALQGLKNIGTGGVKVLGGPNPNAFVVTFTGLNSNQQLPQIVALSNVTYKRNIGAVGIGEEYKYEPFVREPVAMSVRTLVGGVNPVDEVVTLSDEFQHNAQTAIDYLRPLASLPTPYHGGGTRTRQYYSNIHSSSNYVEGVKYVTGSENVKWPEPDSLNWIEPGKEKESKRIEGDLQAHYTSYHSISGVTAYTDGALEDPEYKNLTSILANYKSEHIGRYDPRAAEEFPFLKGLMDDSLVYAAGKAIPPCSIPQEITSNFEGNSLNPFIGGILYAAAIDADGSASINLSSQNWWSSLERHAPAADFLEVDLGETRVVNWMTFEVTRKPCLITLDYDHYDLSIPNAIIQSSNDFTPRVWEGAIPWIGASGSYAFANGHQYSGGVVYAPTLPPWQLMKIYFHDQNQHNIASRFLRLRFDRPEPNPELAYEPFQDPVSRLPIPYSIDVRNLRVGRYAGATPTWGSV